jgi:hypothetical protein
VARTTLEKIADREQAVAATADQVRAQIEQLTARSTELDAEAADLATARKVVLCLDVDEPSSLKLPGLPENPAYQHILTVLTEAENSLRCKDLCHALDEDPSPNRIEGMRAKLKRLVAVRLVEGPKPGLFAVPRPHTGD